MGKERIKEGLGAAETHEQNKGSNHNHMMEMMHDA
jgi:hypothetical protein